MTITPFRRHNPDPPLKSIIFGGPLNFDTQAYLNEYGFNLRHIEVRIPAGEREGAFTYETIVYESRMYGYYTPDGEAISFLVYRDARNNPQPNIEPHTIVALAIACGALPVEGVAYNGWPITGGNRRQIPRQTPLDTFTEGE